MRINRIVFTALLCAVGTPLLACTNLIVGKKASVNGAVMCSYSADAVSYTHLRAHET